MSQSVADVLRERLKFDEEHAWKRSKVHQCTNDRSTSSVAVGVARDEHARLSPLLDQLIAAVRALEHADSYIQYAMEFGDTTKNTAGIECVPEALASLRAVLEGK